MIFKFKAKKASGEEITGTKESADRFSLARELRADGLVALVVEEIKVSSKRTLIFQWRYLFGGVKLKEKIIFAHNLSAMISAGLPLPRALTVMAKQTGNKYFKKVLEKVEVSINKGESLSRALANWPKVFPEVFIAMVSAAEESGRLPEALKLVSEQLEKSYALRRKVIGALIYPAVIMAVIVTVGILMMIFLVPTLSAIFLELGIFLPLSTRILIGLSDFLVNNIFSVLIGLALMVGFIVWLAQTSFGKRLSDSLFLRLPFVGDLTRQVNSAIIMRTTSSLILSGVSLSRTIEITERVVQNYYYKQVLAEALIQIQKGLSLSSVFSAHPNLFPIFVSEMSAVGEETGKLPEMLIKGAFFFEEEVNQVTKNLATVVEPALMILIGFAVGFFAVSIIGPIYSLTNAIK